MARQRWWSNSQSAEPFRLAEAIAHRNELGGVGRPVAYPPSADSTSRRPPWRSPGCCAGRGDGPVPGPRPLDQPTGSLPAPDITIDDETSSRLDELFPGQAAKAQTPTPGPDPTRAKAGDGHNMTVMTQRRRASRRPRAC
jgi:hypothetical protein